MFNGSIMTKAFREPPPTDCPAMGVGSALNATPRPEDQAAAAAYIAELSSTLAALARRQGFGALGYILDLARLEAETISRKGARLSARAPSQ
jgi:hypothetical protein